MGTSLTGTKPKDTYDSLIKVGDNGPISGTAKTLSDGLGNDLPISVSTSAVGIGTSAPLGLFEVKGAGVSYFTRGTKSILVNPNVVGQDTNALIDTSAGMGLALGTAGSERMRVTPAGNVGIGTSSPVTKLDVNGNTFMYGSFHYQGGGQWKKQFIQGSVTAGASGVPVKLFFCSFSAVANIKVAARQSVSSIGTAEGTMTVAYGAGSGGVTTNSCVNNVTGISLTYNNSGYQIEVAVTYSGAAPTIHFYAEGMSESDWTL